MLRIRASCLKDVDSLASIESEAFGPDAWSRGQVLGSLSSEASRVFVGEVGRAVVGWVAFTIAAGEAELVRLAARPTHRRRGIAKTLVRRALATLGEPPCFLEVRDDNTAAIALYRALDFSVFGRRERYYRDGTDALLMRRVRSCSGPDTGIC